MGRATSPPHDWVQNATATSISPESAVFGQEAGFESTLLISVQAWTLCTGHPNLYSARRCCTGRSCRHAADVAGIPCG